MATENEKQKTLSVKEFRMWLQGVEEMQAEGWVPDARQWERIRAKIDQIDDTPTATPPAYAIRGEGALPPGAAAVFQPFNTAVPGAATPGTPPPPSALSGANAPVVRAPITRATPSGLPVAIGGGTPVKTPDVDTSNGKPYNSSFT